MENYVNGSDMLLSVAGKPFGHSTTHTSKFSTETKEVAVKPAANIARGTGLWKKKIITGLGFTISAEGVVAEVDTEASFQTLLRLWKAAEPIDVACFERDEDNTPYLKGKVIITDLERKDPAGEDSTISISLENFGAPEILDSSVLTHETDAGE